MKRDTWATPWKIYGVLDREFGFNLDPCATSRTAKCPRFFSRREDGLSKDWKGARVFCNPPYGPRIYDWVEKCAKGEASVVVALLPASTDTRWFHKFVLGNAEIRFVKGRLKFIGAKDRAPFASLIAIWRFDTAARFQIE